MVLSEFKTVTYQENEQDQSDILHQLHHLVSELPSNCRYDYAELFLEIVGASPVKKSLREQATWLLLCLNMVASTEDEQYLTIVLLQFLEDMYLKAGVQLTPDPVHRRDDYDLKIKPSENQQLVNFVTRLIALIQKTFV
jgi:hypothetical protein